jgi:hypothetical protein
MQGNPSAFLHQGVHHLQILNDISIFVGSVQKNKIESLRLVHCAKDLAGQALKRGGISLHIEPAQIGLPYIQKAFTPAHGAVVAVEGVDGIDMPLGADACKGHGCGGAPIITSNFQYGSIIGQLAHLVEEECFLAGDEIAVDPIDGCGDRPIIIKTAQLFHQDRIVKSPHGIRCPIGEKD